MFISNGSEGEKMIELTDYMTVETAEKLNELLKPMGYDVIRVYDEMNTLMRYADMAQYNDMIYLKICDEMRGVFDLRAKANTK